MDEKFTGKTDGRQDESFTGAGRKFSEYLEQRTKRIQNFSLNMDEPEGYVPKFGAPVSGGDVYSYGNDSRDGKQKDYMELTRTISGEDYDEKYFGENGIYTRISKKEEQKEEQHNARHQKTEKAASDEKKTEQPKAEDIFSPMKAYENALLQDANADDKDYVKPVKKTVKKTISSVPKKKIKGKNKNKKPKEKLTGYGILIRVLGFICAIMFIAAVTAGVSAFVLSAIDDILSIKSDKTVVTVTIPEDSDPDEIIDLLSAAGVVKQKAVCKFFASFRHFDGYTSSETGEFVKTEYAPGIYYVHMDDGLESIMNSMKVGYGSSAETVTVSFPEGWTIQQIFEKLEKKDVCEAAVLYANLDITAQQYGFYENLPEDATRYQKLEGYLFPDTYEFYIGENPNSVISKLFDNFQLKMTTTYRKRATELGLTVDQVLTIASILQREGQSFEQMKTISSIIHNRLNHPSSFPLLQCDSTSDYASNYIVPNVDSYYGQLYSEAYNTYSKQGLPPGPICNPGDDAINAALYPDETNYYYFCHDSEGNMYVAQTFEEQRANMAMALG